MEDFSVYSGIALPPVFYAEHTHLSTLIGMEGAVRSNVLLVKVVQVSRILTSTCSSTLWRLLFGYNVCGNRYSG